MNASPRWPVLGVILLMAVGLAWLLFSREEADSASEEAVATAPDAAKIPSEGGDPAVSEKRTRVPKPASIHPRPRITRTAAGPASAAGAAPGEAPSQEEAPDPMVTAIQDNMHLVTADVRECLLAWWKVDPSLSGKVIVSFDIAPDGLNDVWIEEHSDVPAGPLSCFSAAVYGVDWSGIVDEQTQVTYPVAFNPSGEDAPR